MFGAFVIKTNQLTEFIRHLAERVVQLEKNMKQIYELTAQQAKAVTPPLIKMVNAGREIEKRIAALETKPITRRRTTSKRAKRGADSHDPS